MTEHPNRIRSLLWCGILAPLAFTAATVIFGKLQLDHDPLRQTVSELGSTGRPFAFWFNLNFVLFGCLLILFACALGNVLAQRAGALFLGIIGLLNVAGGFFPMDLERASSVTGVVHTALGLLMFFAYVLAVISLQPGLRRDERLGNGRSVFTVCGAIGLLGILLTLGSSTWTGLGQRIFYLGFFGGLLALALPLVKYEGRRAARE